MAKVELPNRQSAIQPTFASILDTPSEQVERPKPMPVGQYVAIVQGQPRFDKSSKKQTEFVEFTLKFNEAVEVDEEALDTWLEKPDGSGRKNLADQTIKSTYYLTESSLWRLNDFLEHCGAGDKSMSIRQRIAETPGCSVMVTIKHEAAQDGSAVFARVADTAPVA